MRLSLPRALALALALGAAGCGGDKRGKLACPTPVIAPNLDMAQEFRPGGGTEPQDIRFGVKLLSVTSNCDSDKAGLRTDMHLTFVAARADPALKQDDFTYFVALADAQQAILRKQEFTIHVEFAPRQNQLRVTDEIAVGLPVRDLGAGSQYAIVVGLQLTPEQVELNRKRQAQ